MPFCVRSISGSSRQAAARQAKQLAHRIVSHFQRLALYAPIFVLLLAALAVLMSVAVASDTERHGERARPRPVEHGAFWSDGPTTVNTITADAVLRASAPDSKLAAVRIQILWPTLLFIAFSSFLYSSLFRCSARSCALSQ